MSDRPLLAQLATDVLSAEPVNDYVPDPEVEARIIAAMGERIEREATQRTLRRRAGVLAVAAAFAIGIGATMFGHHPTTVATVTRAPLPAHANVVAHAEGEGAVVVHEGHEMALNEDVALSAGDHIVATASGHASIRLSSGTRLMVDPGSDVSVVRQGLLLMFALDAGSLHADVTKQGTDERFVVRTNDAEVEVRGSRFRVTSDAQASCAGTSTHVEVDDGAVVIRNAGREQRVEAGQHWPSDCAPAVMAPAAPLRAKHSAKAVPHEMTPAETSELKAQTTLFGDAVAANRRGDARGAIARFDEYVARYPDSALTEGAAVKRFEILATFDRPRAIQAARAYMQRYPGGFGHDEAASILAGGQ